MRNWAGITQRCPTGTDEVGYSNVTMTESGRDAIWDAAVQAGDVFASSPGTSGIMRKSTENFFRIFAPQKNFQ